MNSREAEVLCEIMLLAAKAVLTDEEYKHSDYSGEATSDFRRDGPKELLLRLKAAETE